MDEQIDDQMRNIIGAILTIGQSGPHYLHSEDDIDLDMEEQLSHNA